MLRCHQKLQREDFALAGSDLVDRGDRVFGKPNGATIHPDIISQTSEKRVSRSGVRPIRFHDLRHTHATIGLRAGVSVKVMSERLGHSTPAFTLQQYAHVISGMQAEAADAIARLVANRTDTQTPAPCSATRRTRDRRYPQTTAPTVPARRSEPDGRWCSPPPSSGPGPCQLALDPARTPLR